MKKFFLLSLAVVFCYFSLQTAEAAITAHDQVYRQGMYDITYPQFSGIASLSAEEKINQAMVDMASRFTVEAGLIKAAEEKAPPVPGHIKKYAALMKYEMRYQSDNLLSFTVIRYIFAGGAHGSTVQQGFTYDLTTGDRLAFADLYRFDEGTRQAIDRQIKDQIDQKEISIFHPYSGVSDKPSFFINHQGQPVVFFQQYEIGPYSIGIQEFVVHAERLQ